MKKVIPFLCAITIASSPLATQVLAAGVDPAEEVVEAVDGTGQEVPVAEGDQTEEVPAEDEETVELETLNTLTLEDVITRGTENNKNLTVLQLNLDVSDRQFLNTQYDKKELARDIKDLERKLDDLKDEKDRVNNFQERKGAMETLEQLDDAMQSIELAIKQLESGQLQLAMQQDEAKEGVGLMLTSSYTNLLLQNQQINNTEISLQTAKADVKKAQLLNEYGAGSKEDIRKAFIAQKNLERTLESQEKDYQFTLADLSFDIGIAYNPSIVVKPIQYNIAELQIPEDYSTLIENSYKMKQAKSNLETAILNRDDLYREYEEDDNEGDDISVYELEQADYQVKIAQENIASTQDGLEVSIKQLYHNADQSFFNYEEALRTLENAKEDVRVLKIRYDLGMVAKYDYDKAATQLTQAEASVNTAKIQNYVAAQAIKALENGYVQ